MDERIIMENSQEADKSGGGDGDTAAGDSSPLPKLVSENEQSPDNCDNKTIANNNQQPQPSNNKESCENGNGTQAQAVAACKRRVRFSVCEYITETLVTEKESHLNPAFENDEKDGKNGGGDMDTVGGSKVRYIGGKLRRDSVHPLVPYQFPPKDQWDVTIPSSSPEEDEDKGGGTPWGELSTQRKICRVLIALGKVVALLALLYFFVCSLDLLSLGFRLLGGSTAGDIFRRSSILQNPVVGLMLGILTTVLVQSSSTSTSILVGMVAAGFMDVRLAIPPIMGANIGTSITNTIVSFTQAGDRDQFRRAFAGATILDMFNWITVIVLLPIEVIFGYLYHVSKASVDLLLRGSGSGGGEIQILSVITNPFVDLIVQLNDTVLECWATPNCTDADNASLIKTYCSSAKTEITYQERVVDFNGKEILNVRDVAVQNDPLKCDFLFAGTSLSDAAVGGIVLFASLLVLCFCLVMIVKLLNSVLQGHVSTVIKHTLNADIPYVPWITGYLAILIGAVMTFLVQSSSVFTSALTPLVGMGVISLNRVYPLTLGANIGTTTTAILASMAAEGKALHPSLQIALCHFYFNITGVLLFYPIPWLRFPVQMAKVLGNTTAKYRWFAIFYLVMMFAVMPLAFIVLSLAGSIYVVVLVSLVGGVLIVVALVTLLQRKAPQILPGWMQNWKWMPLPMRSLQPYDKLFSKMPCCRGKAGEDDGDEDDDDSTYSNKGNNVDGDFVFLTGNKIPPPNNDYGGNQQPRRMITRIVPTRVIRNLANGDYPHKTERSNGSVDSSSSSNGNTVPPPPVSPNTPNGQHQNGNGALRDNGSLESNTVPPPVPLSFEESLAPPPLPTTQPPPRENGRQTPSDSSNGMSSGTFTYTNPLESFIV